MSTYNKKFNCFEVELSKSDFSRLKKFGWVSGESNKFGQMSTTNQFLDNTLIGSEPTLVQDDKGYLYFVRFVSGCFYPLWTRILFAGGDKLSNIRTMYKLSNKVVKSVYYN